MILRREPSPSMIEIIPAILTSSAKEFHELARRMADAGVRRVHLDIGDGSFIPTETILGHVELMGTDLPIDWDVHLMVQHPEEHLEHWWSVERAERFMVHVESDGDFLAVAEDIHRHDKRIGAALNPGTARTLLEPIIGEIDLVQFMTVIPGKQGGQFLPWVLEHVRQMHEERPDLEIAVDGGVTPDTAHQCVAAGSNTLVSGSYVVGSGDIGKAVQALRQAAVGDANRGHEDKEL